MSVCNKAMIRWMACLVVVQMAMGHVDVWDLPPINYSDTPSSDPVAKWANKLGPGQTELEGKTPLEKLAFVLELLDVPVSSQSLVFSKTSKQIGLINPRNPRALYFSENAYVGYVPGGQIEVIVEDELLGPVYYLIDLEGKAGMTVARDTSECFSCHGTTRTLGAPGVLVRSTFPDADGHPLLRLGSETVTDATPIEQRWGGYYVTGKSDLPHLGNRTFEEDGSVKPEKQSLDSLEGRLEVEKYPRETSDVVALVVLEHQCHVHNLITAARQSYRRAHFLAKAIDPSANPDVGQAGRMADTGAERIVDALLFKNESDLGEGLEGDESFQEEFTARFPKSSKGKSLADFRLYRRIFKYRCSYMIYSRAFRGLPPRVKSAVMERLRTALSEQDTEIAPHLKASEKSRIRTILKETLPEWSEG